MKLFTCSKMVPCMVMIHVGMTVDFENTMVKDLGHIQIHPVLSLSRTTMSISCCNSFSVSKIITVSAYLKLLITVPPTLSFNFPHDHYSVQCKQMQRGDTTLSNGHVLVDNRNLQPCSSIYFSLR